MNKDRYSLLMSSKAQNRLSPELSLEEWFQGWHFCPDWDGLLIGPGHDEMEACTCPSERTSFDELMKVTIDLNDQRDKLIEENANLIDLKEKLLRGNSLLIDVIEGYMRSRFHVHYDISVQQHAVCLMFTEDDLVWGEDSARVISLRVLHQLNGYIKKLKIGKEKP